ncbi:MAG TPA: glycosyltransferase family 39 protein [Candidatus Acidoferrales bacterium]|nr:glycosyltransferase family 39 protein [Candidatus Acidoferrales bacterium]
MNTDTAQRLPFSRTVALLILLGLSLLIYVGNAAHPALLDDADAGHAVVSQEMLRTGDWAVLHINGIRWMEKPPLHYWAVAVSYLLLGESAFSTRLPLALAVAGLVLMVYLFGRRFFGDRAGFYAGLVMCTSIGTYMFTRIMIPEAIYSLEFTAAFYLFLCAWTGVISLRAGFWGAAAMCALAVLTRSLIGIVFPVAIVGIFVWMTGRRYSWRELPVVSSLLIFIAIAVPWHVIAGIRAWRPGAPGFFWYYFINEQVLRALGYRYPHDFSAVPLGLWLAAHLVWFFPWCFFLPVAFRGLPRRSDWHSLDAPGMALLFVCIWAGFIFVFFSLTASRMEYYSFSAWPAVALLLGRGIAWAELASPAWMRRLQAGVAAVGVVAAGILGWLLWASRNVRVQGDISDLLQLKGLGFYTVATASFFDLTTRAFAALRVPSALAAVLFLFGFGTVYWLRRRGWTLGANVALSLVMAAFFFVANSAFQIFEPHMSSRRLADDLLAYLKPDDAVAIYGEYYGASALGFYVHRQVLLYNGQIQGLEFGSYYPDAPKVFLDDNEFPALWNGPQRVFLLAPKDLTHDVLIRLPRQSSYILAESGGKVLFVNRPLSPNQPSLAQLEQQGSLPAVLRP